MSRRRAVAIALPIAGLAAAGVVVAASVGDDGRGQGARAATPARGGFATVRRRTLVDRQRVDGTLGYSGTRVATNRLSGTVTWLPRTGAVIEPGQKLFEVDGKPVVLMSGTLPAYRTLRVGVADGDDVSQLESGLVALGYSPGTVDDHYSDATAAAVKAWQGAEGLKQTGRVELGRVVFLPGARRVTDVKVGLGSSSTGGGGGGGGRNSNSDASAPSTDVLETSSTRRVVTAKIDVADQTLVADGRLVRVEMPDARIVAGRITNVGSVATSDSSNNDQQGGGDSTPTITITIRLKSTRAARRLDQAPVSVQIARTTRWHVLAVPVQALVARRGGRYAVERVGGRLVDVTPGVFASGYVEIEPGSLHEGDRVRVPR